MVGAYETVEALVEREKEGEEWTYGRSLWDSRSLSREREGGGGVALVEREKEGEEWADDRSPRRGERRRGRSGHMVGALRRE